MKKLRFLKEYQQFRENFEDDEFNDDSQAQGEHEETEEVEASCQDKLEEAINNLDSAIQSCIGVEDTEEEETQEEEEELHEDVQEEEENEEEQEEGHEEREMEIYNRMKELSEELKQLMSELKGEESQEEETEEEESLSEKAEQKPTRFKTEKELKSYPGATKHSNLKKPNVKTRFKTKEEKEEGK